MPQVGDPFLYVSLHLASSACFLSAQVLSLWILSIISSSSPRHLPTAVSLRLWSFWERHFRPTSVQTKLAQSGLFCCSSWDIIEKSPALWKSDRHIQEYQRIDRLNLYLGKTMTHTYVEYSQTSHSVPFYAPVAILMLFPYPTIWTTCVIFVYLILPVHCHLWAIPIS